MEEKMGFFYMPGEMCMAELVQAHVTGADLNYQGSITIDREALDVSGLLPGQMVYIDNVVRKGPSWRTYIVPGEPGRGDIIMNGPPAYHFKRGDPVTIRGSAFIPFGNMPSMAHGHTKVYFSQGEGVPNRIKQLEHIPIPEVHWRQMCISKLHRLVITGTSPEGPEELVVDGDILDAAGFPPGIEAQFTSLRDGVLRRTCVQAGPRGTGAAEIHGSGAQYIAPGVRVVTLAEVWLPYQDAARVDGPQVAFFNESLTDRNIIREVKLGWRPSSS